MAVSSNVCFMRESLRSLRLARYGLCICTASNKTLIRGCNSSVISTGESSSHVPRHFRSRVRELELASGFYRQNSLSSHKKLLRIVKKAGNENELTSRMAAYALSLSINVGRLNDANELLPLLEYAPPVIVRSLKVKLLCSENRLNEALDVLDEVLNDEDTVFMSTNHSISDEALDTLHDAISARQDTIQQMNRFRSLQRHLTALDRRTESSIDELLRTAIAVPETLPMRRTDVKLSDKIIEQTAEYLSEQK